MESKALISEFQDQSVARYKNEVMRLYKRNFGMNFLNSNFKKELLVAKEAYKKAMDRFETLQKLKKGETANEPESKT